MSAQRRVLVIETSVGRWNGQRFVEDRYVVTAACAECGMEIEGHECVAREAERHVDEHLDDDRAYSTEDDDRVPPEGEVADA